MCPEYSEARAELRGKLENVRFEKEELTEVVLYGGKVRNLLGEVEINGIKRIDKEIKEFIMKVYIAREKSLKEIQHGRQKKYKKSNNEKKD